MNELRVTFLNKSIALRAKRRRNAKTCPDTRHVNCKQPNSLRIVAVVVSVRQVFARSLAHRPERKSYVGGSLHVT